MKAQTPEEKIRERLNLAKSRAGLTVNGLAKATRIRPGTLRDRLRDPGTLRFFEMQILQKFCQKYEVNLFEGILT